MENNIDKNQTSNDTTKTKTASQTTKVKTDKKMKTKTNNKTQTKVAQIEKAEKNTNKPKKIKKPKTKKQKRKIKLMVMLSLVMVLVTLGTFAGIVFSGNDYAMTTVFSNDLDRSYQIVSDAVKQVYEARWLELEIYCTYDNVETKMNINTSTIKMQTIHYDNNSYGYTAYGHSKNLGELETYYKDANLYIKLDAGKFKTPYASAQQSIVPFISQPMEGKYVLFENANMLIQKNMVSSLSTKLHVSTAPFYVGERFVFTYNTIQNEQEIFELDYKGNLKTKTYIRQEGNFRYTLVINYKSINKIFTLNYPSDLNTYYS